MITGAHAGALYRVLRMLASHAVFAEDDLGRFALTPRAAVLQTAHNDSVHTLFRLAWQDVAWDTYRQLPQAVMTGEAAFDHAFGVSQFDYMAQHPEVNAAYDAVMAVKHMRQVIPPRLYDKHATVLIRRRRMTYAAGQQD